MKPVASLAVLLLCAAGGLHAQNSLSASPGTVFLNGLAGGVQVQQTISITSTPATAIPFTAAPGRSAGWLGVSQSVPTTPATVTLTANPAGLAPGVYDATVVLSSPSASNNTVVVILTVNNPSPLSASPANVLFSFQPGGTIPPTQVLSVSSAGGPLPYTVSGNQPWLLASGSGQTPGTVSVAVSPLGLASQYYVGTVTLTPSNGQSPLLVPALLLVTSGAQLAATPASLTFNYQIGGQSNVTQKAVSLAAGGASLGFSTSAAVAPGAQQWLSVSPPSGTTPGTLTVTVTAAGLPPAVYQGTVNVTAGGAPNPTLSIPITLNVSSQPLLDLSTTSLTYNYAGGSLPASQTVVPNSTTAGLPYSVGISTNNTGNWLSLTVPASAVTPNPVTVSVNPTGLPAGTYSGTVAFTATGASNNPQVVSVTLTVALNPALSVSPSALVFNYQSGQTVPSPQTLSVTSSIGALSFTVTSTYTSPNNNVNWLLVSAPTAMVTPASLSAGVNPAGLSPGAYSATITVATPGAASTVSVPVTLNVSSTALLSVNPSSLAFSAVPGSNPAPQPVTVTSTGEAVAYSANVTQGSNWLAAGPPSGPASSASPSTFFVSVNSLALATGVYQGTIAVHPMNGSPDVTLSVTLTVTTGNLAVTPAALSFTQAAGGAAPPTQVVNVASSGSPLAFTAFVSGVNWATVTPNSGITPAALTVGVNAGTMPAGTYSATINIVSSAAGNSPQTVTVTLTVGTGQTISLSPSFLSFTSQVGAAAPPSQTIAVTINGGPLPFTAIATAASGANWLSVTPTTGTAGSAATNLTVSVNPQGLSAGNYTGSISVANPSASNSPQSVNVSYVVTSIPAPAPAIFQNAASYALGAVSAGEIITIQGASLGPPTPASFVPSPILATTLSDTQVLFDGVPAPLLYVSSAQINAIVPYGVTGRTSTRIQVVYQNRNSAPVNQAVAAAAPGIFTLSATGQGQAAVLNENNTVNGASNPASVGSILQIFATGEGQTDPPGEDGKVIPPDSSQWKKPQQPVTVTIGGQAAELIYAGSAPGFVSGVLQVNVRVPAGVTPGGAAPIVLSIGGIQSPGGPTVAVQ